MSRVSYVCSSRIRLETLRRQIRSVSFMSGRLKRSSSEIALGRKRPCPHRHAKEGYTYTWWPWRPNKRRRRRDAAPSQAAASIKESYDTYQSMGGSEFNARPRLPPNAGPGCGWLSSALSRGPFVEETRARSRVLGLEDENEIHPSMHLRSESTMDFSNTRHDAPGLFASARDPALF